MQLLFSPKAIQRALTSDRILLRGDPPIPVRVLSLVVLVIVDAFLTIFPSHNPTDDPALAAVPIMLAVAFTVMLSSLAGLFNRLTLDLTTRTFVYKQGIYPFLRQWQGSLDAIDHLQLGREWGISSHGGRAFTWRLRLQLKEETEAIGQPPGIYFYLSWAWTRSQGEREVLAAAKSLAQKIGLPLEIEPEGSSDENLREESLKQERQTCDGPPGWAITGFDCTTAEPDLLVFQPNDNRPRAKLHEGLIVFGFLGVFQASALFFLLHLLGIVHSPGDAGMDSTMRVWLTMVTSVIFLGPTALECFILYFIFDNQVRNRNTPIIIDRRSDRLLYGKRVICPLSRIRRVILRWADLGGKEPQRSYGVAIMLKNYRIIPREMLLFPNLRFELGPQSQEVVEVVRKVADFIGAEFQLKEVHFNGPAA